MIQFITSILILSAFFFTLLCFVLISRPEKLLGLLMLLSGHQEDWHSGKIDSDLEQRHYAIAKRLEWLVLFALFGWSIFCGAMLAYARLVQL